MRYLNKIIFINTADKSLKYAEVDLDGNVHFIGTQGVGKSTLLRAILFFHNADTQKLGIPREKKNYNEYYFPFQNSYIIYEVQTEAGKYCTVTFKSQGRVAFRFFNSGYDKSYFIDNEGRAFETWDKIRIALGRIDSTRIINNYEEYRNILYGNNKGLANEFRKYALIESKQYQNIPRTIANVFLNAKLDAEFVKTTIINSMTEDEIKIDLTTYSQTHLKDFETNLNDIKLWTDGKIDNQSEKVSTTYSALQFLEQKKTELASQLGFALNKVKEHLPKVQEKLSTEELKRNKITDKLKDIDIIIDKKKGDIQKQIGEVSSRLIEIKNKFEEYSILKIDRILERVAQKSTQELERKNLLIEKEILTSKFLEIQQRYDAQLKQLENQLTAFENNKQTEKNNLRGKLLQFKDDLTKQYESIYEQIRNQFQAELETATANLQEKENTLSKQKMKFTEAKYKRYYENEISTCKNEISKIKALSSNARNQIEQSKTIIKTTQQEWEYKEKNIQSDKKREIEQQIEQQEKLNSHISAIDSKIENSKDSLYGWLNEQVPDWEKTIGKVIDEENILFQKNLNPQKTLETNFNFYGITLNTNEISKNVKTVADLQQEQQYFHNDIKKIKQTVENLHKELNEGLEKLKRKFQPKIKEQKDIIQKAEYILTNNKSKEEELNIGLSDWEKKAKEEQKSEIENIEKTISKLIQERIVLEGNIKTINISITKTIDAKKKEKELTLKSEQQKLDISINYFDLKIQEEKIKINTILQNIKANQKSELDHKGADTKRITDIDLQLSKIELELNFIESNIAITERYKYDKEQLFDKETEFKNKKTLFEKQLEIESEKYTLQKDFFSQQIGIHNVEIDSYKQIIAKYTGDLDVFESFTKTDLYHLIEKFIVNFTNEHKTEQTCTTLTNEIQITDNTLTKRYIELQEAIHKFTGNFQEDNLFSFKVKFTERAEYFDFAEMLKEFVEEEKIIEYKERVEKRFARIIHQIGKETNNLIEKEGEISRVIKDINDDFVARQFVTAIKSVEVKTTQSANRIFQLLLEIKTFNDENTFDLGAPNLFTTNVDGQVNKNEKAISLLKQLIKEMASSREKEITLSDSFELLFRIIENNNDTGWVEKLTNVGSEGTDILVKAMINIMLLNVFKEKAAKHQKDDFRLHCMMDEIGKLHPNNVKGILKFANDRNILLINSSPTSFNATDYRYTYLLSKDNKNITSLKRLIRKN